MILPGWLKEEQLDGDVGVWGPMCHVLQTHKQTFTAGMDERNLKPVPRRTSMRASMLYEEEWTNRCTLKEEMVPSG
jgi:hypothetical protein